MQQQYKYILNGLERSIELEGSGDAMKAGIEGNSMQVSAEPVSEGCILMRIGSQSYPVRYARDDQGLHIMLQGHSFTVKEPGQLDTAGASGSDFDVVDGKQILVAPMPGQVVKVNVRVGEQVSKKQCLVIVEAMKMENELTTVIDGVVSAVHVEAGHQVDAMQALVEVTQSPQ